uniref:uncharacterized protein LOC120960207 isoform X1 n=1 Tax=Anopheles coluzzii TaxID=1518534 RepID=UPI0020FF7BBF|nr:uncharacterized protein LOC120960207 isoform X1 [Anopheles coluzzii]
MILFRANNMCYYHLIILWLTVLIYTANSIWVVEINKLHKSCENPSKRAPFPLDMSKVQIYLSEEDKLVLNGEVTFTQDIFPPWGVGRRFCFFQHRIERYRNSFHVKTDFDLHPQIGPRRMDPDGVHQERLQSVFGDARESRNLVHHYEAIEQNQLSLSEGCKNHYKYPSSLCVIWNNHFAFFLFQYVEKFDMVDIGSFGFDDVLQDLVGDWRIFVDFRLGSVPHKLQISCMMYEISILEH